MIVGLFTGVGGMYAVLATGPGGMGQEDVSLARILAAWTVFIVGFWLPPVVSLWRQR